MRRSVHDLAESYTLDALRPGEVRRFEAHLLRCDACADRVRELAGDTVRLGGGGQGRTRTVRGEAAGHPGHREYPAHRGYPGHLEHLEHSGRWPGVRWREWSARAGAYHRLRRWRRPSAVRLAATGAVVALVVSAVLGVLLHRAEERLDRERTRTRAVIEVLNAGDARPAYTNDDHGRGVTAVYSRALRRAVVTVQGLPRLEGRRVYQVWLVSERPEAFRSIGVFADDPGAGDTPGPLVAAGLDDRSYAFTVTIEPSGGSPQPTADPVAQLPLLALGIGT
ncbi:anti-sigma factor [Streptomyces sp. MI02-7b]|uniref:anti-sigma factor n=1 Tax=Streptomyces sp. MI02-7b TaxID=462941 RepID=UPI0029AFF708|nr:anti-sigma factor [Streptomyces sp. MI02-7b]MDX3075048.1 anti-sigma factor [Streptomyces sp. MI02-7b]